MDCSLAAAPAPCIQLSHPFDKHPHRPVRVVITGAPGTGKTTILEELRNLGVLVVPEAAAILIQEAANAGRPPPWLSPDFNVRILERQEQLEDEALKKAEKLGHKVIICDRGALDPWRYEKANIGPHHKEVRDTVQSRVKSQRYASLVFWIDYLPQRIYESNAGRPENYAQSKEIGEELLEIYRQHKYSVVILSFKPDETKAQRAERLLHKIYHVDPTRDGISGNPH